ncbi:hypothetical protein MC885_004007 [Smutsia gigantea]|nr:hypothetical protein MC885_004007 [Smutsia gigantea]
MVEETTERMATMKTEGRVSLVEVLRSSFTAGWLGSHSHLGARSWGSLPPMRNKLLLEKNPKQLLRLENGGSPSYTLTRKKPLPSISSESTMSHLSSPWYKELVSSLVEQAVSLLICKDRFEKNLTRNLGFISFPVTETLTDLFLGFQKLKGSRISLSSEMNWSCLLCKPEEAERTHQASCQAPWSMSQLSDTSHHASRPGTIHHSPESPSMLPAAATQEDRAQAAEHCLSMESPGPQRLTFQGTVAATEKEPPSPGKPKHPALHIPSSGSSHSQEAVDVGEGEDFFGAEDEPQSPPKPPVAAKVSHSAEAGRGDPREAPHKWHRAPSDCWPPGPCPKQRSEWPECPQDAQMHFSGEPTGEIKFVLMEHGFLVCTC